MKMEYQIYYKEDKNNDVLLNTQKEPNLSSVVLP